MKKFDKWFFPDREEHLQQWMTQVNKRVDGRLTYQHSKLETALKYTKGFGTAVDIGAHVGLWSFFLSSSFNNVHAFEPVKEHIECFEANTRELNNITLHKYALGRDFGKVDLLTRTVNSSGDTGIAYEGNDCSTDMMPLDSVPGIVDIDLIKIDCEGYEANVLYGAVNKIIKYKPVIIVEQKADHSLIYNLPKLSAVKYLEGIGYKVKEEISGDYIMAWGK